MFIIIRPNFAADADRARGSCFNSCLQPLLPCGTRELNILYGLFDSVWKESKKQTFTSLHLPLGVYFYHQKPQRQTYLPPMCACPKDFLKPPRAMQLVEYQQKVVHFSFEIMPCCFSLFLAFVFFITESKFNFKNRVNVHSKMFTLYRPSLTVIFSLP